MEKKNRNKLFNIPNCLCYFRILLIPAFLYVYFNADKQSDYIIAAGILVISGLSDFLDGFIARRYHMVTDFGKIIDPVADKLTQFTIALTLLYHYPLMWLVLAIIVIKDGMLALIGFYLYESGVKVKGASWWGKVATAYFYLVVIILVGAYIPGTLLSRILIITSFVSMFIAFILYAKELYQLYFENRDKKNEL